MKKIFKILSREISEIQQNRKNIRNFGIIFFAAGLVFSAIIFYKYHSITSGIILCTGIGTAFFLLGLFLPNSLKIPHKIWMSFAVVLGYIFTRIILTITYIIIFIPTGFLLKILKKDILDLHIIKNKDTYWKNFESAKEIGNYKKMY